MTGTGPGPQTGIDLVELARVRRLLRENPAAWQGMSTGRERRAWPGVAGAACVLAAKEAALKALQGPGADEVEWDQIEVLPGPPLQITLHGDLAGWARRHRPGRWLGSAAARGRLAVAWVLWEPWNASTKDIERYSRFVSVSPSKGKGCSSPETGERLKGAWGEAPSQAARPLALPGVD